MPKELKVLIYEYDELDAKAKQRAYDKWLEGWDNFNSTDNRKSMEEFVELFPSLRAGDWSYGGGRHYCNGSYGDWHQYETSMWELQGLRLHRWLVNNILPKIERPKTYYAHHPSHKTWRSKISILLDCPFTGTGTDHFILDPFMAFIKRPNKHTTMRLLISHCLSHWAGSCDNDQEDQSSKEVFAIEARERKMMFYASGSIQSYGH